MKNEFITEESGKGRNRIFDMTQHVINKKGSEAFKTIDDIIKKEGRRSTEYISQEDPYLY